MKWMMLVSISLKFVIPSQGKIITVDDDNPADFNSIQLALDAASQGDEIIVQSGSYKEEINFLGKNITLISDNPLDPNTVVGTVIDGSVTFLGIEDLNCALIGFGITGSITGFDYLVDPEGENHTHATISHCILQGNGTCGGQVMRACDGLITNCLIADNFTICFCLLPVISGCHGLLKNCTIANNNSGLEVLEGGAMRIENCIIYHNWEQRPQISLGSGAMLNIAYCDLQGGLEGIHLEDINCIVNWESGNICTDPRFVRVGYWDEQLEQVIGDYHLQSQAGRWDPNQNKWVTDASISQCIDKGDPTSDWTAELWPHGKRINMGAYGGTPEASMSLSDVGNIADFNNNDLVDYTDLMAFVNKWLYQEVLLPEDLNRDGMVNFADFAIFANEWLWEE